MRGAQQTGVRLLFCPALKSDFLKMVVLPLVETAGLKLSKATMSPQSGNEPEATPAPAVVFSWQGKRRPDVPGVPKLSLLETFEPRRDPEDPEPRPETANTLCVGDNRQIMAHWLDSGLRGQVRLIYADPPYDSGVEWARKIRLRMPKAQGVDPVVDAHVQYVDRWEDGAYLQFMYERLLSMRELLAEDGTLWLHCDHRRAHHLRCLLEEVFGPENYLNTITWRSQTARGAKVRAFYFPNSAHAILIFARNRSAPPYWSQPKKRIVLTEAEAKRAFMRDERGFFRTSDPGTYSFESLQSLHEEGRLYAPFGGEIIMDAQAQRCYASNGGNIGVKYYLADLGDGRHVVERAVDNIWDDIPGLGTTPAEDLGYPTQKTAALLRRIISTASQPGDIVLDPFVGSGTTPYVAQEMGRRWLACDSNWGAIRTTTRRLQGAIQRQLATTDSPASDTFTLFRTADIVLDARRGGPEVDLSITRIGDMQARIRVDVGPVTCLTDGTDLGGAADWRAMIDSIAIDSAHDGSTLRIGLSDAPRRKTEQVSGSYELAAAPGTTIAVQVVDIWGRESVVTREV